MKQIEIIICLVVVSLNKHGWKSEVTRLKCHETDINYVCRDHGKYIKKTHMGIPLTNIHPDPRRFIYSAYCKEDDITKTKDLLFETIKDEFHQAYEDIKAVNRCVEQQIFRDK